MKDKKEADFAEIVGEVKRIYSDRANLYSQREKKPPRAAKSEHQAMQFSTAASSVVGNFHFHSGLQKKLQRKIRQGLIRPEACLDLHGYRQQQAMQVLESFIGSALHTGLRLVVVIHGQGYRSETEAVLKPAVHQWLSCQSTVLAWCPAQARDGGAGASYVYLRSLAAGLSA